MSLSHKEVGIPEIYSNYNIRTMSTVGLSSRVSKTSNDGNSINSLGTCFGVASEDDLFHV